MSLKLSMMKNHLLDVKIAGVTTNYLLKCGENWKIKRLCILKLLENIIHLMSIIFNVIESYDIYLRLDIHIILNNTFARVKLDKY